MESSVSRVLKEIDSCYFYAVSEIIGGDAIDPSFLSTASFREQLDELGTQSGVVSYRLDGKD